MTLKLPSSLAGCCYWHHPRHFSHLLWLKAAQARSSFSSPSAAPNAPDRLQSMMKWWNVTSLCVNITCLVFAIGKLEGFKSQCCSEHARSPAEHNELMLHWINAAWIYEPMLQRACQIACRAWWNNSKQWALVKTMRDVGHVHAQLVVGFQVPVQHWTRQITCRA
jgi:hypothetical protein